MPRALSGPLSTPVIGSLGYDRASMPNEIGCACASMSYVMYCGPQVTRPFLHFAIGHYLPPDVDPKSPLASPIFADLTGLPPVLLQAGGDEALRDDSIRFGEAADAAGVDVTVECWEAMMHVWQMLAPRLPEAEAALSSIADWVGTLPGLA